MQLTRKSHRNALSVSINDFSVAMPRGSHPFPSRTRKLSPSAPMVLSGKLGGRVGHCRDFNKASKGNPFEAFSFSRSKRDSDAAKPCGKAPQPTISCCEELSREDLPSMSHRLGHCEPESLADDTHTVIFPWLRFAQA